MKYIWIVMVAVTLGIPYLLWVVNAVADLIDLIKNKRGPDDVTKLFFILHGIALFLYSLYLWVMDG